MNRIRIPAALIAVSLAVSLAAGCDLDILGNDDDDEILAAADYIPVLAAGVTWTYASAASDTLTQTNTVTGTMTTLGNEYWVIVSTSPSSSTPDTSLVRVSGEVMYNLATYTEITSSAAKALAAARYGDTEIPGYTFGIAAGTSWTIFSYSSSTFTFTESGRYLGTETVTTPAGTFEKCAKFENTKSYTQTGSAYSTTRTQTEWFAPGVGPVKFTTTNDSGSATFVLTGCSFPDSTTAE